MKRLSLLNQKSISKEDIVRMYSTDKKSVAYIALQFKCSENKINYWIKKFGIRKRTISDAMYHLKNPLGDPFSLSLPKTIEQGILFGLGMGLYWGEGSKRGKGGLRITNSDPKLLRKFIEFLVDIYKIDKDKLRFSIQIFKDISETEALEYWIKELGVKRNQFYKILTIQVRKTGTYKYKSKFGVAILYFNNIKLKKKFVQ